MKRLVSAVALVFVPVSAFAHPSIVQHDHPHGISLLPDLGAMVMALALIVLGVVALRRMRKE